MSHFNLKTGARWMSASALCSLFALSMGSASAQNDFQQVVTTTTSGNKAFLDVNGKRLQQSIDSLFKWVDDLETLTSTPADPDTVYNYENTLTVQQGGFQAFSTEGGMMGITDFDLDGMNMPVIVGMAGMNLNGSIGNLQIGASDVGWNYLDLNLVGGNNPVFSASPEQILESFSEGEANTQAGNVRAFLDSAEVGQFSFSSEIEGTIEGDQILWAQDSLVFLGKDILNEASGMIESTSEHNHIQVTGDAGIDADDNLTLNGYDGVHLYSYESIHSEVNDEGYDRTYLDISWDNQEDSWNYGAPDENGHIAMKANGGMNLTVDHYAGIEMAYNGDEDETNMNVYANNLKLHSVDSYENQWATLEMGYNADYGDGRIALTSDVIDIDAEDAIDAWAYNSIRNEVSDYGDFPSTSEIAASTNSSLWEYGQPDDYGHIVLNAFSGLNLKVQDGAGIEMASDGSDVNMNLYANEFVFHADEFEFRDGPVVADHIVTPIVQFIPMSVPDNPENGMMFLGAWGELLIYVNGEWKVVPTYIWD